MGDFAIDVTSLGDVQSSEWLRAIVMGAAHVGKTSAVLMTAPKPIYIINCDKKVSLNPGTMLCLEKKISLKGQSSFVGSIDDMEAALKVAKDLVKTKGYKTVVLDTITGFSKVLMKRCMEKSMKDGEPQKLKFWPAYHDYLEGLVDRLHLLPAHVIVNSHWEDDGSFEDDGESPAEDSTFEIKGKTIKATPKSGRGIIPMLGGKSKRKAATWFEDVIFMEQRSGEKRIFSLSIDGVYGPASKSLPGVSEVPADFEAFIRMKNERLKKLIAAAKGR